MMKKFIISILFATTLFELYVLPDVNSINFRHLTVQNGLSQKWVRCIIKDDIGYLWIGTAYGLNKYDGISFTTYKFDINDSNSINHNSITAVFKDSKGNLWIGTQIGFNKYQRETDNFHRIKHIQNYVNSFLELKDGNLMVGSPGGLYVYDPVKDSSWQINTYFNIEKIIDVNGQIWLGTRQGIYIYDTLSKSFDYLKITDNQLPIIKSLYIDKNGTVWAGTENLGLFSIKKTYSSSFKYQIKNAEKQMK